MQGYNRTVGLFVLLLGRSPINEPAMLGLHTLAPLQLGHIKPSNLLECMRNILKLNLLNLS